MLFTHDLIDVHNCYFRQMKLVYMLVCWFICKKSKDLHCSDEFLPARRYASAGYSDRNVSVCPSVCPSRAGIVSKRRKLAAW